MKKTYLVLLLSILPFAGKGQDDFIKYHELEINQINRVFLMGHITNPDYMIMHDGKGKLYYEPHGTSKNEMSKLRPVNMTIRVIDSVGNKIEEIEVDYNDLDIDLSGFESYHIGEQSYLIFKTGRYRFNLINLMNYHVIGPFLPDVQGPRADSQDGSIGSLKTLSNGQYILGYSWGMGLFCYNLADIQEPVQLEEYSAKMNYGVGSYLFLNYQADSLCNAVFTKMTTKGSIDTAYFLFQGLKFETDSLGVISKQHISDGLLKFNEIKQDTTSSPLIINFIKGYILNNDETINLLDSLKN